MTLDRVGCLGYFVDGRDPGATAVGRRGGGGVGGASCTRQSVHIFFFSVFFLVFDDASTNSP